MHVLDISFNCQVISKTKKMTNVYIIKFIETELIYCYTSIEAIFAAHTKEEIGITHQSFYKSIQGKTYYKNKKVIINKITAYNKTDIEKNLHKESAINTKNILSL